MQLKHIESLIPPSPGIVKVTAICWSPNAKKLAVCTTEKLVLMFDENGARKDKFATKAIDKGPKNYIVREMAFSPQSDKLALAQSDNIVYIYKIGNEWGEKKSICNKFTHSSSISCMVWPTKRQNDIVYGLAEGKVKIGQMKSHTPATLYQSDSYVTVMACNCDGNAVVSAHLDGSIYIFYFDNPDAGARMIARHSCVPFALAWANNSIVVAGNNNQVIFYDEDGVEEQTFDMSDNLDCKEFTLASSNPTGDAVVLGNFNSLYIFTKNKDTMSWEDKGITKIDNMYSVTAMDWKPDGDKLAVGTLCGVVDLYDVCIRRTMFKGGFELTYVSHSQVIVRQIETNMRIVVRSQYGREILKTNIYKKRYVVANTIDTILLGDLQTLKLSEIQWHGNGTEKYIFDNPSACIIYFAGEISIVEYGIDEILGSVRTQYTTSHVLSLRINERPLRIVNDNHHHHNIDDDNNNVNVLLHDNKKVAYLLDQQTICIKDLITQSSITISHDSKIDWLELNSRGNLLLFRDKRRYLHLYNIETQIRNQLLNFCTYVQWVPNSDVVVAQNRNNLCVWYNINASDQITIQPIKGDIDDIERSEGKTEVIVDEGITQAVYPLDENLIEFATALDDFDYLHAMDILEGLVITSDVEAMWKQLYQVSLQAGELRITQRCAAAVCDVSTRKFLENVNNIALQASDAYNNNNNSKDIQQQQHYDYDNYQVRYHMYLLKKDLKQAENLLLNQGKLHECIEMYQKLMKYEDAIRVAEQNKYPDTIEMKQAYYSYLLDTNQEEKAASLKVKEHDYLQAINLYLKGGMPGKAAQVILENDIQGPIQLLDQVATALTRAGLYDKAGDFYEKLSELQRALDCYIRGNAYRKAVELARKCFPAKVVELQELWGDYLVAMKHIDMAINHYIEAKVYHKAIESSLNARQHNKALQLVDAIDIESARPYYKQLARYYEDIREYELAERCYVTADQPHYAVEMHTKLGHWDIAHKIAMTYMKEGEVALLYINQAQKLENKGRLKEAEKLYLAVKEKDLAINMYKKHRRFDEMIRLVSSHRPDLLKETHQFLAQTLEMEGSLREAENHYVEAQEWHSAVNMYRSNELWDDAIRVAKFYGGIQACKRVTIALIMAIGVVEGSKYLSKHQLVDAAIEHATENGAFDIAVELATHNSPKKLTEIYLKHALLLEDDDRFREAEEEFIKANKPREAIDMYVHQQDWLSAIRIAENYDPSAIPEIYIADAKAKAEIGEFKVAEDLYVSASRPELALTMYEDADKWTEALKLAQMHLPHRVAEVNIGYQTSLARQGKSNMKNDYLSIGKSYEHNKQWNQAIDAYLNARATKIESINDLEDIWERAIEIARNFVPNRHVEVAVEISKRLVEINRVELAADILFEIGRKDDAITILITSKKYEKAKMLSQGNNILMNRINEAYQDHLVLKEDTKELVELGHSEVAVEVLAKRGDWEKVWEVSTKENLSAIAVGRYVMMRVEELMRGKIDLDEAVRTLNKRNGLCTDGAITTYRKLVIKILQRNNIEENEEHIITISLLRDILYRLANQYRSLPSIEKSSILNISELLMVIHYQNMLYMTRSMGLKDITAKCAITLLKYPELIPSDKAFYQAGMACRDQGNINLSFLLLNRYVDLTEAIDSGDASFLDTTEFQEADGIPLNDSLPAQHYLDTEDDREAVRTWVLSVVTDTSIEQRLPHKESTRNTVYEGLYASERPTCIVTGYPIHPADMLEVNNSTANRRDWNAYVVKTRSCPWTGLAQNPLY